MLRIGTIVLGVDDVHRAIRFWTEALSFVPSRQPVDPEDDWVTLVPASGDITGAVLALDTSVTPVQEHPRVHLDLLVDSPQEMTAEVQRLVGLGASEVDWDLYPDDPDFVVLADTEGNRFCIVDTSHG